MRLGLGFLSRRSYGRAAYFVALAACSSPSSPASAPPPPAPSFDKQTLDTVFRAEGVGVFDVNRDGHPDIVTDQLWFSGPELTPHAIRPAQTFDAANGYSLCFAVFGDDLNGDGWLDAIVLPRPYDNTQPLTAAEPLLWYENPRGQDEPWTPHTIAATTAVETAHYVDLFGDGRRELVLGQELPPPAVPVLVWLSPAPDPNAPWIVHDISDPKVAFAGAKHYAHGLGTGDVDGDGRLDVLTGHGWFQQTADRTAWILHPLVLDPANDDDACSDLYAWDVDGDGRADLVCSRPHSFGLHWLQQQPGEGGEPTFVDHLVDDTLSQMHALDLADLDGDGTPEIVSGKRWWAHGPSGDPGAGDPSVLAYYVLHRGSDGVSFERHDIDTTSGVGTQFPVTDVDGDGKVDIVIANKHGLFFFRQRS
jgi:hypothetical protein